MVVGKFYNQEEPIPINLFLDYRNTHCLQPGLLSETVLVYGTVFSIIWLTCDQTLAKQHKTHLNVNLQWESTLRGICQSPTNDFEDDMRKLTQIRTYMTGMTETSLHTKGGSTFYGADNTLDFKSAMKSEIQLALWSQVRPWHSAVSSMPSIARVETPSVESAQQESVYKSTATNQHPENMGSANFTMICDHALRWLFNMKFEND